MEEYIVSARKYRPSTFKTVIGQPALTRTLKNAIDSHRLAQAYLFCGPRGVGKTSCARIFAKTINCLNPTDDGESCNECESCRAFNEGRSYNIVELDAASNNSVDNIRNITEQVRIPPQTGNYKVFIIDEVHMLSSSAFNAFLKTLEEPPQYVIFILATTEKHKVIPTVLSRCQTYDFNRITVDDIVEHLTYVAQSEGISAEPAALNVIAQKADGAMRDALSIFDQVAASSMGNITYRSAVDNLNVLDYEYYFRLVEAFSKGDVQEALLIFKDIRDCGFDSHFFISGLGNHLRQLMVAVDSRTESLLEVGRDVSRRFIEQSKSLPLRWYYRAMEICNECDLNYRLATNKQFHVELALIRLCNLAVPQVDPSRPSVSLKPEVNASKATDTVCSSVNVEGVVNPVQNKKEPENKPQAVTQPAKRTAPPRMNGNVRGNTPPRINNSGADPGKDSVDEEPSTDASGKTRRKEAFSTDDLIKAWSDFMNTHSSMHILVSAMRNAIPKMIDEVTYSVVAYNPAQQQMMESSMPQLLGYLRDRLSNDFISLRVELAPEDVSQRILSPREFLEDIVKSNNVIAEVLRDFDAELA